MKFIVGDRWEHEPPAQPSANAVEATLAERASTYGSFEDQANLTQHLKLVMRAGNWGRLPNDMREALEMIASKIARILNGDPDYVDSWHDIIGYARLIEKRLEKGDSAK